MLENGILFQKNTNLKLQTPLIRVLLLNEHKHIGNVSNLL